MQSWLGLIKVLVNLAVGTELNIMMLALKKYGSNYIK